MFPTTDQYFVFPFTKGEVKLLIKCIDTRSKFSVLCDDERETLKELESKLKGKISRGENDGK